MRNYSIFTWFGYNLPMAERAVLIREVGFDTVMLMWSDAFEPPDGNKEDYPGILRNQGLSIENIHLPFANANDIWLDNLNGQESLRLYETYIDDCMNFEFPTAVMHLTRGETPPPISSIGIDRLKKLADKAAGANVILALENLRWWNYLDPVFEQVDSPGLGFCYDSGHALLYNEKPYELPVKYADKLAALHLHDNMMEKDDHRIPIEGMINLHALVDSIVAADYKGPLSLEVANPQAGEEPLSYLKRAYGIATVLEKLRNYEY